MNASATDGVNPVAGQAGAATPTVAMPTPCESSLLDRRRVAVGAVQTPRKRPEDPGQEAVRVRSPSVAQTPIDRPCPFSSGFFWLHVSGSSKETECSTRTSFLKRRVSYRSPVDLSHVVEI